MEKSAQNTPSEGLSTETINKNIRSNDTWLNLEDAISAGLNALNDLDRANFSSGVHFCPPHFVDHSFFTEEMALAYRDGTLKDGPLRDYRGKIWEELIYHALKDNLPKLLDETSIKCMWVFYGTEFPKDANILSQLSSFSVDDGTEIDLLICCLTHSDNILLIPVEVKKLGTSNNIAETKAKIQCEKNVKCLIQLLELVLQRGLPANEIKQMIRPAIIFCHQSKSQTGQPLLKHSYPTEICSKYDIQIMEFNAFLDNYNEFKYDPNYSPNKQIQDKNFFKWLKSINMGKLPTCAPGDYARLNCLLTIVVSCKFSSNKKVCNDQFCYRHFNVGQKAVCMKGITLCPKYIHQYIVKNVDFLTYLKTFCVKTNECSTSSEGFAAYPVHSLNKNTSAILRNYLSNMTNEQRDLLQSNKTRVVIIGDYGGGKTFMLLFKAMMVLLNIVNGSLSGRIRFITTANAMSIDVLPKFKQVFTEETLEKHVIFETWQNCIEPKGEDFLFLDEFCEIGKTCLGETPVEKAIRDNRTHLLNNDEKQLIWVVVQTKESQKKIPEFKKHIPILNDFEFYSLRWQLRNSHSITHLRSCLFESHTKPIDINYPIFGARCRIHQYFPQFQLETERRLSFFLQEMEYWLAQLRAGSILLYTSQGHTCDGVENEVISTFQTRSQVEFLDLDNNEANSGRNGQCNIKGYFTRRVAPLAGLEFDVVIVFDQIDMMWKTLSRAKYGVSVLDATDLPNYDEKIKRMMDCWGRFSVFKLDE